MYDPTPTTSVEELLQVQRGTPTTWSLYGFVGQGDGGEVFDLHVDTDGTYWVQNAGRLHRGSLEGTAEPLHIGKVGRRSEVFAAEDLEHEN